MIYLTGDINLTDWYFNQGFGVGTNIAKGLDPYKYLERQEDDLWIGNFEGVVSSMSNKEGMNAKVFRIEPDTIMRLNHFQVYGFANNHAMQHGFEAYQQTVETLENCGCEVFGTLRNKSCTLEVQNEKLSLTGMCLRIDEFTKHPLYWHNPEYEDIQAEITSLPANAFKVLFVHWGNEYINRPSSAQKKFAHWLIDIGFDLIIGMHPHVLQGYEDYKGKRIYYSLGNFVFDMAGDACKYGAVVGLDLSRATPAYTTKYVRIENDCCPKLVEENEVPARYHFSYLNECLLKDDNSEQYHAEILRGYRTYRKANHKYILNNMIHHPKAGIDMLLDFVKRRF